MLAVLIALSLGTVPLLFPLFAWKIANSYRHPEFKTNRNRDFVLLGLCTLVPLWLVFLNRNGVMAGVELDLTELFSKGPPLLAEHVARLLLLTPWLGMPMQNSLWTTWSLAWVIPLILSFLIAKSFTTHRHTSKMAALFYVGGIALWPLLNWLARPGAFEHFMFNATNISDRYAFPLCSAGLIFWMTMIRPEGIIGRNRSVIGLLFVLLNVFSLSDQSFELGPRRRLAPFEHTTHWSENYKVLESSLKTGCPANVFIQSSTSGSDNWGVYYTSPLHVNCATTP